MATTDKFKQINSFAYRAERAPNSLHLKWMQHFTDRVSTLIVTELGQDCPQKIVDARDDLAAAVQVEDDCYRIITRSALTEQIQQADQVRDNTFLGIRTMVEALERVGTAAQKEAAPRVLQAIRDYHVTTSDGYTQETANIEQLIQQMEIHPLSGDCSTLGITALVAQLKQENLMVQSLIDQRSEEQSGIDTSGMPRARQAVDKLYVEAVMTINAFAITEQQSDGSPFDHAIDVINEDEDYYIQHVFPRGVKKLKITATVNFSYYAGETWREAVDEELESNQGWTVTDDNEVLYQQQRLTDKDGVPVDSETKVKDGQYLLEDEPQPQPDDQGGGDVTPVTPE